MVIGEKAYQRLVLVKQDYFQYREEPASLAKTFLLEKILSVLV